MKDIIQLLQDNTIKNVAIAMHDNPDADAIGSAVALEEILLQLHKNPIIVLQNKINIRYSLLIGNDRVNKRFIPNNDCDLLIIVDCAEEDRIGLSLYRFKKVAVIDHHIYSEPYGNYHWCENVVATGVLVYRLMKALDIECNNKIATALYASIRNDSFDFRLDTVNNEVFNIVADLLTYSVDIKAVNKMFKYPRNILQLYRCIANNMIYDSKFKILYTYITKEELKKYDVNSFTLNGIVNMLQVIEDVDVSILFIEQGNDVFMKLRSDKINVAEIAQEFGGNGHKFAAGAKCYTDSPFSLMNKVTAVAKNKLLECSKKHN